MFPKNIVFISALFAFAGCSSVPEQADVTHVSTPDLINRIRCEAKHAISNYPNVPVKAEKGRLVPNEKYKSIIITYNFEFIAEEKNNLRVDGSYVLPIHLGTLTLGGGNFGSDRLRRNTDNITISESFAELRKLDCDASDFPRARRYPIVGHIGIEKVISHYFELMPLSTISEEFNRLLFFKTAFGAGAKPSVALIPVPGRKFDASLTFGGDRSDSHEVRITLQAVKKDSSPEDQIKAKTIYVRFLDGFDDKGNIVQGKVASRRAGTERLEGEPPSAAAPSQRTQVLTLPPSSGGSAEDDNRNAQRKSLEAESNKLLRDLKDQLQR